ncbi:magnesium transporter CorA family protein [Hydromonas duriensis]|nr:magnesium transporter CorA family protein [Hydromonas duriensis]
MLTFNAASQHPLRPNGEHITQEFVWIDALREDVAQDSTAWQHYIAAQVGCRIDDFHITDILNTQHPSFFDLTHDYEILTFRKLISQHDGTVTLDPAALTTAPVVFIITKKALITVHEKDSRTFNAVRNRIIQTLDNPNGSRQPVSSLDLMLRIINALVDKYLELRTPLTRRIDLWQTLLLQGNHRFNNWSQLLKERLALHQLDNLCEEQLDALQELRDEYLDKASTSSVHDSLLRRDMMMVRINDLMEHVTRVQNHAARLENALKSAVELHFSANAHQTNENLRFLAILSAIFGPLTLLTGIYGMNFDVIPGLHNPNGFWWMMGGMLAVTCGLLYYFRSRRLVGRGDASIIALLNSSSADKTSQKNIIK